MKVALFQSDIFFEEKEKNISVATEKIKEAKKNNCSLIAFPEMSFTGFSLNTEITKETDETLIKMQSLAVENKIAIGFGYVKDCGDKCENHYVVVDKHGNVLSDYVKLHPFSFEDEDRLFNKGNSIIRFTIEGIRFCTFICYDLRFPEIFQFASKTADAIIVAANWPKARSDHWSALLKARAIENQCYMLGVNCVGVQNGIYYSGDSTIISPDGTMIISISNIQGLVYGHVYNDTKSIRESFPVKSDRREDFYQSLYKY